MNLWRLKYGYGLLRTKLFWSWRLKKVGSRSTLGKRFLMNRPKSIAIGEHTMIHDRWSMVDLSTKAEGPARILIGSWCRIQHDFQVNSGQEVSIGDHCLIAPRVFITDSDHIMPTDDSPLSQSRGFRTKPVEIQESCWIGVNTVILKGVTIGHHSVVGANAVVTKSVPPYSIVAGSPAKVVGQTQIETAL